MAPQVMAREVSDPEVDPGDRPARRANRSSRRKRVERVLWLAFLPIAALALVIGSQSQGPPPSFADQVRNIALTVRCPTCEGESAAVSQAPASQAIRAEIARRLLLHQPATQIRDYFVTRYGEWILESPPTHGTSLLIWILPGGALLVGGAVLGLVVVPARSRRQQAKASADDEELVRQELARAVTDDGHDVSRDDSQAPSQA
jgi:cytochrome c-type biogenesis protein CcmH